MPQYMLLIYVPAEGGPSPEQLQEQSQRWVEYTQSLVDAGVMVAGDALEGLEAATTVRVRDGETLLTDGPFAETKEFLAGYYLVDCPDLDTALGHAARLPNVGYGSTEVRPVMKTPASADAGQAQEQATA